MVHKRSHAARLVITTAVRMISALLQHGRSSVIFRLSLNFDQQ
jgi:hypothetical protein